MIILSCVAAPGAVLALCPILAPVLVLRRAFVRVFVHDVVHPILGVATTRNRSSCQLQQHIKQSKVSLSLTHTHTPLCTLGH
jgi:hypothetical protein